MQTERCVNCNVDLEAGFDICWKCGADVDGGPPDQSFTTAAAEIDEVDDDFDERTECEHDYAFNETWAGQARAAKVAGETIFQADIPLSKTRGYAVPLFGAFANSTASQDFSNAIQSIEAEGWRLEHVGYVYRLTGSDSRDKFLMSGQQEAFSGETIGIYLFRATAA